MHLKTYVVKQRPTVSQAEISCNMLSVRWPPQDARHKSPDLATKHFEVGKGCGGIIKVYARTMKLFQDWKEYSAVLEQLCKAVAQFLNDDTDRDVCWSAKTDAPEPRFVAETTTGPLVRRKKPSLVPSGICARVQEPENERSHETAY